MQNETESENQREWKAFLWTVACCVPMFAVIVLILLGYWNHRL